MQISELGEMNGGSYKMRKLLYIQFICIHIKDSIK